MKYIVVKTFTSVIHLNLGKVRLNPLEVRRNPLGFFFRYYVVVSRLGLAVICGMAAIQDGQRHDRLSKMPSKSYSPPLKLIYSDLV